MWHVFKIPNMYRLLNTKDTNLEYKCRNWISPHTSILLNGDILSLVRGIPWGFLTSTGLVPCPQHRATSWATHLSHQACLVMAFCLWEPLREYAFSCSLSGLLNLMCSSRMLSTCGFSLIEMIVIKVWVSLMALPGNLFPSKATHWHLPMETAVLSTPAMCDLLPPPPQSRFPQGPAHLCTCGHTTHCTTNVYILVWLFISLKYTFYRNSFLLPLFLLSTYHWDWHIINTQ